MGPNPNPDPDPDPDPDPNPNPNLQASARGGVRRRRHSREDLPPAPSEGAPFAPIPESAGGVITSGAEPVKKRPLPNQRARINSQLNRKPYP